MRSNSLSTDKLSSASPQARPLQGIRVLDFSRIIAGPYCAQYLADLGADVIKVERKGLGDDARQYSFPAVWGGTGTMFLSFNRGKRSIALDMDLESDRLLAWEFIGHCDVLIENFRPGVMTKLGLGPDSVRASNPGLVYCSISGFGEDGPLAHAGANDLVAQAATGVMSLNQQEDGRPQKVVPAIVDMFTGLNAAVAIVAAIHERSRTKSGAHITTSLFECGISMLSYFATSHFAPPQPHDKDLGASITVPNQAFRASDGWMVVACSNEPMWQRMCEAIGKPQLRNDPRYATNLERTRNQKTLIPLLEEVFATATRAQWAERLDAAKTSNSSILSVGEVLSHPQTESLGMVVPLAHPQIEKFKMLRAPFRFGGKVAASRLPPPGLDQHRQEIIAELNRPSDSPPAKNRP